jgi:predicted molibdopterin-dependent oxidoreductase YjgC
MNPNALLHRLCEKDRATVPFVFDGVALEGLQGDTVLTAVLSHAPRLRTNEFSGAPRAGFCLMGACQDCWVATIAGQRLRACSTPLEPGMQLRTLGTGAV